MRSSIPALLSILFLLSVSLPARGQYPSPQTVFFNWYFGDEEEREELTAEDMKLENVEHAFGQEWIDDLDLPELKYFPNLKAVSFYHAKVTDEGILTLADLKVERIRFESCENLTYAGIHALRERMPNCTIVTKDIQHMKPGPPPQPRRFVPPTENQDATQLEIPSGVRDSDLSGLAYFPRVEEVTFEDVSTLSPNALVFPAEFAARLKSLELIQRSSAGLPELPDLLRKLVNLETLILRQVPVTTELLEAVADMPNLKSVTIQYWGKCPPIRPGALAGWRSQEVRSIVFNMQRIQPNVRPTSLNEGLWRMTPADLTFLAPLKKLETLQIPTVQMNSETYRMLSQLENLKTFEFAPEGAVEVEDLALLKQLRELRCNNTVEMEYPYFMELCERLSECDVKMASRTYAPAAITAVTPSQLRSKIQNEPDIREISTKTVHISDVSIGFVRDLKSLEVLNLEGAPISDAGLAQLENLPALRTLNLCKTQVTDAGLRTLIRFPNLTGIQVEGDVVSNETLKLWQARTPTMNWVDGGMRNKVYPRRNDSYFRMFRFWQRPQTEAELEAFLTEELERRLQISVRQKVPAPDPISWLTLDLRTVGDLVSDETIQFLVRQSPQLEVIHLSSKNVTEAGIHAMTLLPNLECLTLQNVPITEAGLKELATLPHLDTLWLEGAPLTDEGVKTLETFPRLRTLTIRGGELSEVGTSALGRMPRLKRLSRPQ